MVFRCERIVLFGTWFGHARAIAELVRGSSSSVLCAGTDALGKLEPEIFVNYAGYFVSLLRVKDEKVRRAAVEGLEKLNPRALSILGRSSRSSLRDMHWRVI